MRVLITGASGPIGQRLAEKIIAEQLGNEVEFVVAQSRMGYSTWFDDYDNKAWINANLDEVGIEWWEDTVSTYEIDTIYYLETNENWNDFTPSAETLTMYKESDTTFLNFIVDLYIAPDYIKPKVIYLSTDKIYQNDEFPDELNPIDVQQPEGNAIPNDVVTQYAVQKFQSELTLTAMTNINLRIIRPFSMVAPEQDAYWPMTNLVLEAIKDADIPVFEDGLRGLVFTHVDDFVSFMTSENLFDDDIALELTSRIINVCRVWNYLPEEYLVRKVISKTESSSEPILGSDIDNFEYQMRTPQIRNMQKIYTPKIPIEMIIEEMNLSIDPVLAYDPLQVTQALYIVDNHLQISGYAEAGSGISIFLEDGSTLTTDTLDDGSWTVTSGEPIDYTDTMDCTAFATSTDGIQYDTVIFEVPPAVV